MKKSTIIWCHIIFWILSFVSYMLLPLVSHYISVADLGWIRIYTFYATPLFFYIGYFSIMKLLKKKRILLYAIIVFVLSYAILFLISQRAFSYGVAPLSSAFVWIAVGGLFRFFIDWFQKRSNILSLKKENAESELALLRTQINPHFLFNTLNNIDALIKSDPEKASLSLSKLSEIMRYMLKEQKTNEVLLKEEVDFLENYISLERLRLKNDNFLKVDIQDNYPDKKIAPMLLIPFVENAFKHSIDSNCTNGIAICLAFDKNKLIFTCENKFDASETGKDTTHGIGLKTVKKRLDMLYHGKHSLDITSDISALTDNSIFKVKLETYLNEN